MLGDTLEGLASQFLTSDKFYKEVNEVVWDDDITYMEAIMIMCDKKEIDPEDLVKNKLISPLLKSKLQEESTMLGLLKPEARLPI